MNRNQRKYGKITKKNSESKIKVYKDLGAKLEVVLPPRGKGFGKPLTNRSCFVAPEQRDFGQLTKHLDQDDSHQYKESIIPNTIDQLRELKTILYESPHKVEIGLQCNPIVREYLTTNDGAQWQSVENIDEVDSFIANASFGDSISTIDQARPRSIQISEEPKIKVIAEKFTKYKKNNIEVRKLDEKVVCVEYDVFNETNSGELVSLQKMRAFFSIKPSCKDGAGKEIPHINKLPSDVQNSLKLTEDDLKQLHQREVEIIDDKISENRPYLKDLRNILKKKQNGVKKNKNQLDLLTLYEMAKKDSLDVNFSKILTKQELQDIKELILKNCTSSAHGISRRKIKGEEMLGEIKEMRVISESIVTELLRADGRTNVFK